MDVGFSDTKYFEMAKKIAQCSHIDGKREFHKPADAFMLLIKGVKKEDLENLCEILKIDGFDQLTNDEIYSLTQGEGTNFKNNEDFIKDAILFSAYKCLKDGKKLGNSFTPDGKINTSDWISHSLYEAKLAGELAMILGLDKKIAETLGLVHDIGRKRDHSNLHTVKGFELLIDEGWINEASATLTHSFIDGCRCASCDAAEEGFYLDEEGKPSWKSEENKDEITRFLEMYKYNKYDDILNIADLMATSDGIVSPYDRVADIATRKKPDIRNRGLFLSSFTNKLLEFLECDKNFKRQAKTSPLDNIDKLEKRFQETSELFFKFYQERDLTFTDK